jgi:hypothetical protein
VYIELDAWLQKVREAPRKFMNSNKANWENIKPDLQKVLEKIQLKNLDTINTVDTLWNIFKTELITSIESNVPYKMITYKHRLPWVTPDLRKLINKKNKAYNNRKKHPEKNSKLKNSVQKELRAADCNYIEQIICDLPINEPGQLDSSRAKSGNLFSYIKSTRSDNSWVAPLEKEGTLITETEEKANILNQQFQSGFINETDLNIPDKGQSLHLQMSYMHISETGINKLLANLNPHKASGPDSINGRVLKELKDQIAPILTNIVKKNT